MRHYAVLWKQREAKWSTHKRSIRRLMWFSFQRGQTLYSLHLRLWNLLLHTLCKIATNVCFIMQKGGNKCSFFFLFLHSSAGWKILYYALNYDEFLLWRGTLLRGIHCLDFITSVTSICILARWSLCRRIRRIDFHKVSFSSLQAYRIFD